MKLTQRLGNRLGNRLGDRLGDRLGNRLGDAAEQARERARERLGRGPEAAPAVPDAPGSRPRAAFAGVLDGRHLWLAVDATPGTLALRATGGEAGSDRMIPLTSDLAEDDPRYRSVRTDLSTVPGSGSARFEAVITGPGGKLHRIWTPPLPRNEPITTPAGEHVQWRVARGGDGTLELVREPVPPGAVLLGIDAAPDDTVTLRIRADGREELRLVHDDGGDVLLTRRMVLDGDVSVATLTPADVPEGEGLSTSVYAGDLPVRRRANELVRPDSAVLLPQHQAEDGQSVAVVYRWLPDGVLRVRRPKAGQP